MKRLLAWAGIFIVAGAFLALVIASALGASPNVIMALIFCLMIIPIFIYAFLMTLKLKDRKKDEQEFEQNRGKQS